MEKQTIYKDKAKYYDLIYTWKDYKKESEKVRSLIAKYKRSKGKDLLEVACGTGKHARYLKSRFTILATDINPHMLAIARKNVRGIAFKQADMLQLNLNKKFDVILCLFSSIGYVKTLANLQKAINNFSRHLKTGGVIVIEPWLTRSSYKVGVPHMTTYKSPSIDIARVHTSKVKGTVSIMDMHHLVGEKGKDTIHFIDRHEMGLFEVKDMLKIMKNAGLSAKFLREGLWRADRGLYIGVKK